MKPGLTCVALRHLGFEDLGMFEELLVERGYRVHYLDVPLGLGDLDPLAPDLLVVLGGPIGAYEEHRYPFLTGEIDLIRRRLTSGRPILALCLGAQLLARAAGAAVHPGSVKEIGFGPVTVDHKGPLRNLANIPMLHWHGDTFELPTGAVHLASTPIYKNQAYALGTSLALQFHPELDPTRLELWLVGHAVELAAEGVDLDALRTDAVKYAPAMIEAGQSTLRLWLDGLA